MISQEVTVSPECNPRERHKDQAPGVGACQLRVTHAALNKDQGLIDPVDGRATQPGTPRGRVGDNFADAVAGAIAESRRQWRDFQAGLTARYGTDRSARMICALTHDDPVHDCGDPYPSRFVIVLLAGTVLTLVVVLTRRFRTVRPAGRAAPVRPRPRR